MSPYGASATKWSEKTLGPTSHKGPTSSISVHHVNVTNCPTALIDYLRDLLDAELEKGMTYPQEAPIGADGFRSYFFQADAFVGIAYPPDRTAGVIPADLDEARSGREWSDCVAGAYYVKPNYPGRSSHICNGGFIVPPAARGKRYGYLLAQSYLHYAPQLGYRGSVFNLVYKNNLASVAIWDRLGFQRVGLIPGAGKLKKADGSGEEYVDAIIFYKNFEQDAP